jgi:hypothetical protein
VTSFPFLNQSFDAVVMAEVVEHLIEDYKTLQEVRRVLREVEYLSSQFPITMMTPSITYGFILPAVSSGCFRLQAFTFPDTSTKAEALRSCKGFASTRTPSSF